MSEAYQCERCKKFGAGKAPATVSVRPQTEQGTTKFHKEVCENCSAIVQDFIEDVGFDANAIALRALKNMGIDTDCGACMSVAFTGTNINEHTCEPKPEPVVLFNECQVGTCNLRDGHAGDHNQFDSR